ncbi:protein HEADING DATE 3B-like [Salvia hispanica]|uniref:protein HEADING DATE 3B-like n=1 Tax=Salvia hispanica TaxID=49212 RepID=UPI00200907C8|nr:protein HEADING DATE 3B-like [Salvia hispanica]XP_047971845.1 protein HEADING DATE 3B-like [Salvia hispanica]
MKRGNDGEKIMGPMFPRLHVNDTEKGGPRAPPRNKMALYEQLSIPSSHRFSLAHNPSAGLVQGGGNGRGMFFARQLHPMHPSEMQYSQYSELSTPLAQLEQRKKVDEDDYTVPVFIQPVPAKIDKYSNRIRQQKFSPSDPPHPSLKFQKAKGTGMFQHSVGQEEGSKKGENSNQSVSCQKQTVSSVSHDPGTRLRTDDSGQQELCAESRLYNDGQDRANMAAAAKTNSSDSEEASLLGEENMVHDLSDDTGSHVDESSRHPQIGSLERGNSVSESSILNTESALDITPDDIVGILGQKHFWQARRAIMNQQRVFAVQLFELHRLIKVQKMIAAWPNLLVEDSGFVNKPTTPILGKKRPLDSKEKCNSDTPCHKKERSAENSLEKVPFSAAQNEVPPSSCRPSAITSNDPNNARTPLVNHAEGHQWLIPVMSPSEGLVYKPYPAPGFPGQGCGSGPNPATGGFLAPVFTAMPQYPFPSLHPYAPHGYFPYGMPMMSPHSVAAMPTENNSDGLDRHLSEEIEVQWSSSSSPSERQPSSSVEAANILPVLPTQSRTWVRTPRVIKVVPRNGVSASESAARIFQSIQEERMQHDSM